MTRTITRQLTRTVAAAVLVGLSLAADPAAARPSVAADTTTTIEGRTSGYGLGYNLSLNGQTRAAAYRLMAIGGQDVPVYCIQLNVAYNEDTSTAFTGIARGDAAVANIAKVADIARRSSSIGTTFLGQGTTADEQTTYKKFEASAVQLAIWKLTDNLDLSQVPNTQIRNRASELASLASNASDSPVDVRITGSYSGSAGSRRIKATVTSGGTALSGATVTFSGGANGTVTTGAEGTATLAIGDSAASVNLTVSRVVPAGTVLAPASGQKVITATSVTITASALLAVPAAAQPAVSTPASTPPATTAPAVTTTTVAPTTTAAPTTTLPIDDPLAGITREANSSSSGKWLIALAVLLLIAAGVYVAVRLFGDDEDEQYRN